MDLKNTKRLHFYNVASLYFSFLLLYPIIIEIEHKNNQKDDS